MKYMQMYPCWSLVGCPGPLSAGPCGPPWGPCGPPWALMGFRGPLRAPLGARGRSLVGSPGLLWAPLGLVGQPLWAPLGPFGRLWVPLGV